MKRMERRFGLVFGVLATIFAFSTEASAQGAGASMEVRSRSDGGVEVRFRNGCWINYNRHGRRGTHAKRCRDRQYQRADAAAREHIERRGARDRNRRPSTEHPVVTNRRGSGVHVSFRNGCRISFDGQIRQIGQTGPCHQGQYRTARNAARDYYRRQGSRPGPERPIVRNREGAGIDVSFRNGCRVSYDRRIRQIGQAGPCRAGQYRRAADAARDYYRRR